MEFNYAMRPLYFSSLLLWGGVLDFERPGDSDEDDKDPVQYNLEAAAALAAKGYLRDVLRKKPYYQKKSWVYFFFILGPQEHFWSSPKNHHFG